MSKTKSRPKDKKNNRPKSKNNSNGKAKKITRDHSEYNAKRVAEGTDYREKMKAIAGEVRRYLGIPEGVYDVRVSAVLILTIKEGNGHSYWGTVNHFERHPDDVKLCEMKRACKKSWYHLRISEIDPKLLQHVTSWMGNDGVQSGEPLSVDSSGFATNRNDRWIDAKYGPKETKSFRKLHMIGVVHGKICAAKVTDGDAADSPVLKEMLPDVSPSDGYFLGDAAYGGRENCELVAGAGRTPIFMPKATDTKKGFNARGDMLRFREEHPRTFHKLYALRNNIESAYTAIKKRFGETLRAAKERTQKIELLAKVICYNMVV